MIVFRLLGAFVVLVVALSSVVWFSMLVEYLYHPREVQRRKHADTD